MADPQRPAPPPPPRGDQPQRDRASGRRDVATRMSDHASIDRLTDDVLPRLIGRLDDSALDEIEVREDDWRIRLRRPAPTPIHAAAPGPSTTRAADGREARDARHDRPERAERASRSGAPHHGPGSVRVSLAEAGAGGNGSGPGSSAGSVSPGSTATPTRRDLIATSPTVGVFQPRPEIRPGSRVRAGDRLAFVDLLGVPQDVVAPTDGVVTRTLVSPGEGVEYGQDLMLVEAVAPVRPGVSGAVFAEPEPSGGAGTTLGSDAESGV